MPGGPRASRRGTSCCLYCTGGYARYPKSVPGIGVVEDVDHEQQSFNFDYERLSEPVPLDDLRLVFEAVDARKLDNIRFNNHWLFEIGAASFFAAVGGVME